MNKKRAASWNVSTASLFLRVGIGFSFLYAGIAVFLDPNSWIGFVPGFIENLVSKELFLYAHGLFDFLLALWLISGKKTFYASILASLTMSGIVIFNLSSLDILFRDISILFAAIALALLSLKDKE